jgi:hypothetical protein
MMRVLVVAAVALVLCVSCATPSPQEPYLGEWRGAYEGETFTAQFDENNRCVFKEGDGNAYPGSWTVGHGHITMNVDNDSLRGTLTSQGDLVLSDGPTSVIFRKVE